MKKVLLFASLLAALSGCSSNEPSANSVKDICGNTYKTVTIGTQTWMAENMKCNNYDTNSEMSGNSISTSKQSTTKQYYADATINFEEYSEYAGNLSKEQIKKLGYLYNWAAAVGIADGSTQTTNFTSNRQGICPNGWHIPSKDEYQILVSFLGGENSNSGNKLKTTSGWYNNGNGTDEYGFAVLPGGAALGGSAIGDVGTTAYFCTSTTNATQGYGFAILYNLNGCYGKYDSKSTGVSVRCIKN